MRVYPADHPVLLNSPAFSSKIQREKICQIMFGSFPFSLNPRDFFQPILYTETFNTPAMYIALESVLGLYSSGRCSGIVLDIGDGLAQAVPIFEGYAMTGAITRLDIGGRDITRFLANLMNQKGFGFGTTAEFEIAREVKEKLGYVAFDFQTELDLNEFRHSRMYSLTDSRDLLIGHERFIAPECLFQPSLLGRDEEGIHKMLARSMNACLPLPFTLLCSSDTLVIGERH